jgi:zinc resistance-associated protein
MWKPVIAATAALALLGSSLVFAQQSGGGGGSGGHHRQVNPDRYVKRANARIAAIKAGLELTPDQQQQWGAYQQSLEDLIQFRAQRMQARQAAQQPAGSAQPKKGGGDPFARLSRRVDAMTQSAPLVKKMADAGEPLYQSLSDAQKGRFKMLTQALLPKLTMMGQRANRGQRQRG